ncbi:TadE/TadG family type IV pilus assembly protein [Zhihengliuella sp.]|uniref:TadE/TadG family type IV pilus assembly protein n=1 Tax=Zhihengliuella sp. TaxID=1954483 RepID=UPI0028128DD8|nr:TadE/TadG family type IV pilus assembly protein [Zhihengliuella sp.]
MDRIRKWQVPTSGSESERGTAVAEFVMVVALLTAVFLSVLQLTLLLHVRNTIMDAAAAGARYGTLADRSPSDGVARTREIVSDSLSPVFAEHVTARSISRGDLQGLEITVETHVPLVGFLPVAGRMSVEAEALRYD